VCAHIPVLVLCGVYVYVLAAYSKFVGHSGPVFGTSFSPDNSFLLSCSEDSTVRLWHAERKFALVTYKGHSGPVWATDWSSVGYYFATASNDTTARLWATDRVYPLRIFVGHTDDVEVRAHPDSHTLSLVHTPFLTAVMPLALIPPRHCALLLSSALLLYSACGFIRTAIT
jgi:WD40 repeat protein